jgi:hypothetical protein
MNIKIQQIIPALDYAEKGAPVMAAEAWMDGPTKPRHAKRKNEIPEQDVSLNNLSNVFNYVEIKPPVYVKNAHDIKKEDFRDVDLFLIDPGDPNAFQMSSVMYELFSSGKPVLPPWDNWGYAWRGKLTTGWAKNLGHYSYVTMGFDDVKNVLQAVRGIKFIHSLNILYIGDIPSHSVNADINPIRIYEKFGCTITPVSFHEYADEVEKADMKKAKEMANRWKSSFNMMDNTESKVEKYTSIYIAVKKLMEKYEANALTVDCAYLPSVELVPCVTASLISDEGYPFGCEGDTNQLITAAMMMGVSGHATLMGNLFENALHKDILNNQIVINHDVLPPSMACKGCKINFRDFHEQRKGSTLYADLKKETVTMGGMNFDSSEMWLSKGNVAWTEDTAHCRISIGFEVEDAKRIARESLGHHQVIVYGDYIKSIQMMCDFLNLKYRNI